jgi:lipoyl(octanoyl) transferase
MPESAPRADKPLPAPAKGLALDFYLVGQVPLERYLAAQRRLAYDVGGEVRRRILVVVCEHEPIITVGRRGSRGHIRLTGEQLRQRQLNVLWLNRGGGCILHGPGQLSLYVLAPLDILGWTPGEFMHRLQDGVARALQALAVAARPGTDDWGLWGRSGQLAAMGVAVRYGITQYGVFLNVNPPMGSYRSILTPAAFRGSGVSQKTMGCLVAERSQGVKMSEVKAALVEHLCAAFDGDRHNVFSRHPLLPIMATAAREPDARAS